MITKQQEEKQNKKKQSRECDSVEEFDSLMQIRETFDRESSFSSMYFQSYREVLRVTILPYVDLGKR